MEPYQSTTPFGRRTLTLAHVAGQVLAKACPPGKAVHKWAVFRAICAAKVRIGVPERALIVLDALLSFHPETALTEGALIVWPSNQQLALRAHGMAPATLRRHLAALVEAKLIVRRDSPNGKRYARKSGGGEVELAFGFDLGPIVSRADEFEAMAAEIAAEERALRLVRERLTLCRRDIAKMIAAGLEQGVPTSRGGQGPADWIEIHALFRRIVERIPRTATRDVLEPIAEELTLLADEILNLLESHVKTDDMNANESHSERHKQNSNPGTLIELEPVFREGRAEPPEPLRQTPKAASGMFPLGMVLDGCPDIIDYGGGSVTSWRDFLAAVAIVRPMLGISPSAWEEAQQIMGEIPAAVVVACILQRAETIQSAGGYLRGLTRKAEDGKFSFVPMLMALIGSRKRDKRKA